MFTSEEFHVWCQHLRLSAETEALISRIITFSFYLVKAAKLTDIYNSG